jgi:hypothetical protein
MAPEASAVNMEDFGKFNPAETSDFYEENADEAFDEIYGDENAGA